MNPTLRNVYSRLVFLAVWLALIVACAHALGGAHAEQSGYPRAATASAR